jgi:hypothetical protein
MKSLHFFIYFIIFSGTSIFSQTSQWEVFNTMNSGLPNNGVNKITQDNEGNYWIATMGGIAKYDGSNWTSYTTSTSNLSDDRIKDLVFDGTTLWIGYVTDGIAKFDGTTFTNYDLDVAFNSYYQGANYIHGMDMDSNHNLWLATGYGLIKYNGTNFSRYHTGNGMQGTSNLTYSVKCNKTNNDVWVGTFYSGLQKFNGSTFIQYYLHDPNTPYWGDWQEVNSIEFENDGDIWVSGSQAVIEFDKNTMQQKATYNSTNAPIDPLTWGIAFDHNQKLWVGSDCLYGVFYLKNGNWTTYNETNSGFPQGICYWINTFHVDQNNTKWMAHNSKGVVVYNETGLVGITENRQQNHTLKVFPNPTENTIAFNITYNDVMTIDIYDYTGKLVGVNNYSGNRNNLELEAGSLNPGVYSYQLTTVDFKNYTGKFIKN